ncbi:hypothetical protein F9K88_21145 [Brucella intermedia]|uniref:transcriptional regulator domain-containing protein n=1 Tax=Brucella intermedia TaxID=94625 RepID=UPI000AAC5DD8|nr:DUF6499 domain-containing protein [Brucella intermedia]KAB2707113.1 hypothetical protein F9K88_21145 [Brucella intermedia]
MEALQDWTSARFDDELGHLERGGVTFEFLRRNKRYRNDYEEALSSAAPDKTKQAEAEQRLCQRWGITFPG